MSGTSPRSSETVAWTYCAPLHVSAQHSPGPAFRLKVSLGTCNRFSVYTYSPSAEERAAACSHEHQNTDQSAAFSDFGPTLARYRACSLARQNRRRVHGPEQPDTLRPDRVRNGYD